MPNKQQLESNADSIVASADQADTTVAQFCILWSGIIKPALDLVKSFTGPKIDQQIENLEKAADNLCAGTNPDVKNYCLYWNTFHIKALLKMVEMFTGPKVDAAINKFIAISDSLCEPQ
ncbi:MAG: hypothetical protein JSS82_14210 [Bacteroidetes bacterium]|nr:hypothetical protein [Bacteroidota bacterium]